MTLKNIPEYAFSYEFIVARKINGDYWFYKAYENGFEADQVASEIDGVVIHNVRVQGYKKP